jgi:signal transduction histidine kinase
VARLWAGGLLVGLLLAGGVVVAVIGGVHQQKTINTLTRVVQPLQVANTELRSGFSQCQTWYLSYRLTGRVSYLDAYRTCGADFRLTLGAMLALARRQRPALVPLILSQRHDAGTWYRQAGPAASAGSTPGDVLNPSAVAASVSFFAANAVLQQKIDHARAQAATSGEDGLASEIRYGGLFIAVVLGSMVIGVTVVVRSVVRPLAGLTPTLARLTAGDHTARTTVTGPAEIAVVARAIDNLADEGERLLAAEREHARLRTLAREAGVRIRANLQESEVIREALSALQRDLDSDLAFLMLLKDGRLELPGNCPDGLLADLAAVLPADAQQWPERMFDLRFVVIDLHGEPDEQIPARLREPLLRRGYGSALVLPVAVGDEALGLAAGLRKDGRPRWRQMEIDAFEWIAAELGRGLKHAQMYEAEGKLVARLRSLDQTKSDFMATVSHELRTPLTSIAGYVEILLDGELGPVGAEHRRVLATIERNAARLRNLIEDVLTLSKIEVGSFRTVMQPVRLADVISAAVAAVSPAAGKGRLTLTTQVADPELTVNGDEGQLDRVLINLLSNAVKFTSPGGSVSVSAARDGHEVAMQVTDTGMGIPEQDQRDLFNRFFRASNAVKAAVQGTGLGLSIVRTIIANHGGELDLRSAEGQGTTVTIRLPLPRAATDGSPQPGAAGRESP